MNITEKLDQLSEYQSQIDALELQKQELLNQIQVPEEVLSAQIASNVNREKVDRDFINLQKKLEREKEILLSQIVEPELPAEYQEAVKKARDKRAEIQNEINQTIEAERLLAMSKKAGIDAELNKAVANVYAQINQRKLDIEGEFYGKSESAKINLAKLTEEIKAEIKKIGESCKGQFLHAVYVKGRTTWKTDVLDDAYFTLNEVELISDGVVKQKISLVIRMMAGARKVGEPSVTIRKV
jgi:hypothetical protein